MTATFPQPDRAEIALFVETLFRYADPGGCVALRCFRDDVDGVWNPAAWSAPPVEESGFNAIITAATKLAAAAAAASEPVVFASPVATFKAANGAAEKDIRNGVELVVECDAAPETAREKLENLLGPATIAVASGGVWQDPQSGAEQQKLHLHWRLSEPTRDFADHVRLKEARRLAMMLAGADGSAVPLVHPLRWPGSWHRKGAPRLARIVNLRADIEIVLSDALEQLREAVAARPPEGKRGAPAGDGYINRDRQPSRFGPAAEALDINAALAVIPNDERNWKRWSDIGMAVWRASGGSEAGYCAWVAWSSKFKGFNLAATSGRWDHYLTSPPGRIGAGTLFYLAREAWPGWERPSEIRGRRDNDPGEPSPHITGASEDIEPVPAGPEPKPPGGNGHNPSAEEGSDSPIVDPGGSGSGGCGGGPEPSQPGDLDPGELELPGPDDGDDGRATQESIEEDRARIEATMKEKLATLNRHFAVVNEAGKCIVFKRTRDPAFDNREVLERITFDDFSRMYFNRWVEVIGRTVTKKGVEYAISKR